jgi:hypothetical protein
MGHLLPTAAEAKLIANLERLVVVGPENVLLDEQALGVVEIDVLSLTRTLPKEHVKLGLVFLEHLVNIAIFFVNVVAEAVVVEGIGVNGGLDDLNGGVKGLAESGAAEEVAVKVTHELLLGLAVDISVALEVNDGGDAAVLEVVEQLFGGVAGEYEEADASEARQRKLSDQLRLEHLP